MKKKILSSFIMLTFIYGVSNFAHATGQGCTWLTDYCPGTLMSQSFCVNTGGSSTGCSPCGHVTPCKHHNEE